MDVGYAVAETFDVIMFLYSNCHFSERATEEFGRWRLKTARVGNLRAGLRLRYAKVALSQCCPKVTVQLRRGVHAV